MAPSITLVFFSPAGHAEPEVRQDMAFTASTETGCGSAASYTNMFTNQVVAQPDESPSRDSC
jgi:hypothetical protein